MSTLEVVCGPMFAGKTTALMHRADALVASGLRVRVMRPNQDTRSATNTIESHVGRRMAATAVQGAAQVLVASGDAQAVLIDEAHFFGAALVPVCTTLCERDVQVIVAGVDLDHLGEPFEPFPALLAMARTVHRLRGTCARCGAPSTHTQRLVPGSARIMVGGAEAYEPRCASCFVPSRAD